MVITIDEGTVAGSLIRILNGWDYVIFVTIRDKISAYTNNPKLKERGILFRLWRLKIVHTSISESKL